MLFLQECRIVDTGYGGKYNMVAVRCKERGRRSRQGSPATPGGGRRCAWRSHPSQAQESEGQRLWPELVQAGPLEHDAADDGQVVLEGDKPEMACNKGVDF